MTAKAVCKKCFACSAPRPAFRCARCVVVVYCTRICAEKDADRHELECARLQNAEQLLRRRWRSVRCSKATEDFPTPWPLCRFKQVLQVSPRDAVELSLEHPEAALLFISSASISRREILSELFAFALKASSTTKEAVKKAQNAAEAIFCLDGDYAECHLLKEARQIGEKDPEMWLDFYYDTIDSAAEDALVKKRIRALDA